MNIIFKKGFKFLNPTTSCLNPGQPGHSLGRTGIHSHSVRCRNPVLHRPSTTITTITSTTWLKFQDVLYGRILIQYPISVGRPLSSSPRLSQLLGHCTKASDHALSSPPSSLYRSVSFTHVLDLATPSSHFPSRSGTWRPRRANTTAASHLSLSCIP